MCEDSCMTHEESLECQVRSPFCDIRRVSCVTRQQFLLGHKRSVFCDRWVRVTSEESPVWQVRSPLWRVRCFWCSKYGALSLNVKSLSCNR